MGTFDNIYANKIKQLEEENRRLRSLIEAAQGPPDILRSTGRVSKAAKKGSKGIPRTNPPTGPGTFGHGYGQPKPSGLPPLVPGQVLPGSGSGPSGAGTFGQGYSMYESRRHAYRLHESDMGGGFGGGSMGGNGSLPDSLRTQADVYTSPQNPAQFRQGGSGIMDMNSLFNYAPPPGSGTQVNKWFDGPEGTNILRWKLLPNGQLQAQYYENGEVITINYSWNSDIGWTAQGNG